MKTKLAPTYIKRIGDLAILWFQKSNSYVVINTFILEVIQLYLKLSSKTEFISQTIAKTHISKITAEHYYEDISTLLENNNVSTILNKSAVENIDLPVSGITETYTFNSKHIQINYKSEQVKKLIHPQIENFVSHLKVDDNNDVIDIDHKNKGLYLYYNGEFIDNYEDVNYHMLKGKITMLLLCFLTEKKETDWIGTLHASTIGNKKEAIMFIGKSGSGKSTLSALLNYNGFDLVTDDITPILSENLNVYEFPSAISLKKGGFETLKPYLSNSESAATTNFGGKKGLIRYITPKNQFSNSHLPCNKVVLVQYSSDSEEVLRKISLTEALQVIIPDSWLSPLPQNAAKFLDWLEATEFYKLEYNNSNQAIIEISNLFK